MTPAALLKHAALLLFVVGQGFAVSAQAKSDVVTAEAPDVGSFQRVDIAGRADLVLIQGDREAVVVQAPAKAEARVRVRSNNGRLSIEVGDSATFKLWTGAADEPTVIVYFRTIESLRTSGSIKVTAAAIVAPSLDVTASGAATIRVDALKVDSLRFTGAGAVKGEFAGSAAEQTIQISGAGSYRGAKLVSDTAKVTVSGAGKVSVNAKRQLDASISGAGAIEYFGDPELRQRVSGAGKITRRPALSSS
jgi:hypothetical protein